MKKSQLKENSSKDSTHHLWYQYKKLNQKRDKVQGKEASIQNNTLKVPTEIYIKKKKTRLWDGRTYSHRCKAE